jgi:hypothetical protein
MREATIQAQLAAVRAEFARVEAEYRVLVDLTANYERWLAIVRGDDEPTSTAETAQPADESGGAETGAAGAGAAVEHTHAAAVADDRPEVTAESAVAAVAAAPAPPGESAAPAWASAEPAATGAVSPSVLSIGVDDSADQWDSADQVAEPDQETPIAEPALIAAHEPFAPPAVRGDPADAPEGLADAFGSSDRAPFWSEPRPADGSGDGDWAHQLESVDIVDPAEAPNPESGT